MPLPRLLRCLTVFALTFVALCLPAAMAELPPRVSEFARALGVPEDSISVWVQELGQPQALLAHRPDTPRTPASTLKLVPTFAALQALGPAWRWRTDVYALGPVEDGVLKGDLLLRGYGDPFMVAEELWKLVGGIRRAGIARIEGELVFDTSYFELPPEDPGAFDNRPNRVYNLTPHPLLVNFTSMRFDFAPRAGGVQVSTDPVLPGLTVDNRLRLAPKACGGYQRGVALRVVDGRARRDLVRVEGRFPARCQSYSMTRTVLTPEAYAFALFNVYWQQSGASAVRGWRNGSLPAGLVNLDADTGRPRDNAGDALVHVHWSWPLGDVVRLVNKYSNNVMTRHLQLTVGAERFGPPATPQKGRDAVTEVLAAAGVPVAGLVLDNPSGLSREARISARQLGTLLAVAWDAPYMPEFVSSLAIAGVDGTVRRRYAGKAESGRMHLKTGTMDDVSSIAGYVQARDGRRYAVAMLINAPQAHRGPGHEIQDALLHWLYRREAAPATQPAQAARAAPAVPQAP